MTTAELTDFVEEQNAVIEGLKQRVEKIEDILRRVALQDLAKDLEQMRAHNDRHTGGVVKKRHTAEEILAMEDEIKQAKLNAAPARD